MPIDANLTKNQLWGLRMLGGFSDALRGNRLAGFLQSDELERFLHDSTGGSVAGKTPGDGTPGSKLPGIGLKDPLNVLHGLFEGKGSQFGKIDHPGGAGLATESDGMHTHPNGDRVTIHTEPNGDRVTVLTRPNGDLGIWTAHTDGSADAILWGADGNIGMIHVDHTPNHDTSFGAGVNGRGSDSVEVDMYAGANTREVITLTFHNRDGAPDMHPTRSVWRREQSPGEDGGGDTNSGRNPLDGIEVVGPQSMQQMLNQMKHPDKHSDETDPNNGPGGINFTGEDKERLGRIAPGAKGLDPNSGVDPLSGLNLDPSRLQTRSEKDDRVDPNTGVKPRPGKG